MVDDGRKVYSRHNATDAQTGRTISTPDYQRGSTPDNSPMAKGLLYGSLLIGLAAFVAAILYWVI